MSALHPRCIHLSFFALFLLLSSLGAHADEPRDHAATDDPCLQMGDLDFGTLRIGNMGSRTLRLSNDGGGVVSFNNPSGGAVVEWLHPAFRISQSDLERLRSAQLRAGEFIDINVTFTATESGEFIDTGRFHTSARSCRTASCWRARVIRPGVAITGYDWQEQWNVRGECAPAASPLGTKNSQREYAAEIYAFNTGDVPAYVDRIELQGPDVAYFELDRSDPLKTIASGDWFGNYDTVNFEPRYYQRVLFRPGHEERVYSCDVVLVMRDGFEARNTLRGIGIESHIAAPGPTDFGREIFEPNAPAVTRTVTFATSSPLGGTRPVSITDLRIIPANPQSVGVFTILNAVAIVGATLPARATFDVLVAYAPTAPGEHAAELVLGGSFSPCDDSTASLIAERSTLSVRPTGSAMGTIAGCFDTTSSVFVENDGSDSVVVRSVTLEDMVGAFEITTPTLPLALAPGERLLVPVRFAPNQNASTDYTARVVFGITDVTGTHSVGFGGNPVAADVVGRGERYEATAHITRDAHGLPGDTIAVEVVLDRQIDAARIDELDISFRFAHEMMRHLIDPNNLAALVAGTILDGWTVALSPTPPVIDPADSRRTVIFLKLMAPAGEILSGTGTMLRIPFAIVNGDTSSTELPFFVTPTTRLACAEFVTSSGFARVDSVPGSAVDDGLVEAGAAQDPATREVVVTFRNVAPGDIAIDLFNTRGELVHTVAARHFDAGRQTVRVGSDGIAVGQYFVRFVTSTGERTIKLMLAP